MRNKIKQLLKKEGGFTLIELLAVIAILGFIIAISVPLVGDVITKSKATTNEANVELIIDAAQMYELQEEKVIDGTTGVKTETLVSEGYLENKDANKGYVVKKDATTKKYTVTK